MAVAGFSVSVSVSALLKFWTGEFFLGGGDCPVHSRTFSRSPPSCDNQKCLHILSNVPCGARSSLTDNHCPINRCASSLAGSMRRYSGGSKKQWWASWHFDIYKNSNVTSDIFVVSIGDQVIGTANTTLVCLYSWLKKMLTDSQRSVKVKT